MELTAGSLLDLVRQGGLTGLLLLTVVGSYRGWWIWQSAYKDLEEDRDWWRSMALDALGLTERTVSLHERLIERKVSE